MLPMCKQGSSPADPRGGPLPAADFRALIIVQDGGNQLRRAEAGWDGGDVRSEQHKAMGP